MSHIVIAGGGIAGLATALATAAHGHVVTVLERRGAFTELGAGIQLAPNAFRALDRLGVAGPVLARAVHIDELRLMDGTRGTPVARLPLGAPFRQRYRHPYVVVHRNDLYAPLLARCRAHPRIGLRTDTCVVGYRHGPDGVRVDLADGRHRHADALIGADGLRSAVRAQLVGDGEPRVSGHTIYRAVVPIERVPPQLRWNAATLWAADRRHVVHYPIAGGRSFNLAATIDDRATEVVAGVPVDRSVVLDRFDDLCAMPRRLLELGVDWRRWVLCDRDPVRRWNDGPVVLLGDAAHPMLQYAAQGACQAVEDAVCVADNLGADRDPADAFRNFTAERVDRAGSVQVISRRIGTEVYHAAGAAARERDAMFAVLTAEGMYERLDWLYGAAVPATAGTGG